MEIFQTPTDCIHRDLFSDVSRVALRPTLPEISALTSLCESPTNSFVTVTHMQSCPPTLSSNITYSISSLLSLRAREVFTRRMRRSFFSYKIWKPKHSQSRAINTSLLNRRVRGNISIINYAWRGLGLCVLAIRLCVSAINLIHVAWFILSICFAFINIVRVLSVSPLFTLITSIPLSTLHGGMWNTNNSRPHASNHAQLQRSHGNLVVPATQSSSSLIYNSCVGELSINSAPATYLHFASPSQCSASSWSNGYINDNVLNQHAHNQSPRGFVSSKLSRGQRVCESASYHQTIVPTAVINKYQIENLTRRRNALTHTSKHNGAMPANQHATFQQCVPLHLSQSSPTHRILLFITSANVNGLRGKIDELRIRAKNDKPHIIACQETKVGDKVKSTLVSIPNYNLFRKDRNESGGGVALYVDKRIKAKQLCQGIINNLELVAVQCKWEKNKFIAASVYRPPGSSITEFVDGFANFISSLGTCVGSLILTGDLNLCALSPEFKPIQDICDNMKLIQLINQATHKNRLIDQIFVHVSAVVKASGIAAPIENIHVQTWAKLEISKPKKDSKWTKIWSYKKTDWRGMNMKLMESNLLQEIINAETVQHAAQKFISVIVETREKCIPQTKVNKSRSRSWINTELINTLKAKKKAYLKWRKQGTETLRAQYKKLVKRLKKETFLAKKKFLFDEFTGCKDYAEFWKRLNMHTGRLERQEIPMLITKEGTEANNSKEKAEALLVQFQSVFKTKDDELIQFNQEDEHLAECSIQHILRKIKKMPSKKSPGIDGISVQIYKNCSLVIGPCLVEIANRCLKEGDYPDIWKEAIVTAIPKTNNLSHKCEDYRPISLLPIAGKLVESGIREILLHHVQPKLSNNQYGFHAGKSTADALLVLQHHILRGFEKCERAKKSTNVCVIYFDVAKAFDTVSHNRLLNQLHEAYNLPHCLLNLLKAYLTNSRMRVKVKQTISRSINVTSGVVQGSTLGPTLFVAYINKLAELTLSEKSDIVLYADDIALVHPLDEDASEVQIQDDINKIQESLNDMGLKLNAKKCQYMIFSLSPQGPRRGTVFRLNEEVLIQVDHYKYLGIVMDEKMTFSSHTKQVVSKTKRSIGALSRWLRKWASSQVLGIAIQSISLPILMYAIEVWYPPDLINQKNVEKIQKFGARLVSNDFRHDVNYEELLAKSKWKPLFRIVAERRLTSIHGYMNGTKYVPQELFPVQNLDNRRRSSRLAEIRNTNRSLMLCTARHANTKESKLAACQMVTLWNSLDEDVIRHTLGRFKEYIKSDECHKKLLSKGAIVNLNDI
jgi:exonuclease III